MSVSSDKATPLLGELEAAGVGGSAVIGEVLPEGQVGLHVSP